MQSILVVRLIFCKFATAYYINKVLYDKKSNSVNGF